MQDRIHFDPAAPRGVRWTYTDPAGKTTPFLTRDDIFSLLAAEGASHKDAALAISQAKLRALSPPPARQ